MTPDKLTPEGGAAQNEFEHQFNERDNYDVANAWNAIAAAVIKALRPPLQVQQALVPDQEWRKAHELWKQLQSMQGAHGAVVENPEAALIQALSGERADGWTAGWNAVQTRLDELQVKHRTLEAAAKAWVDYHDSDAAPYLELRGLLAGGAGDPLDTFGGSDF